MDRPLTCDYCKRPLQGRRSTVIVALDSYRARGIDMILHKDCRAALQERQRRFCKVRDRTLEELAGKRRLCRILRVVFSVLAVLLSTIIFLRRAAMDVQLLSLLGGIAVFFLFIAMACHRNARSIDRVDSFMRQP
jgi:hypothetical protein